MAETNMIDPLAATVLHRLHDVIERNLSLKPSLIVYLRTNPENLLRRIASRGRKEEDIISLAYLEMLHSFHEERIQEMQTKGQNVLVIDADSHLTEERFIEIYNSIRDIDPRKSCKL